MSIWASWELIGSDQVGPDDTVLVYEDDEVWPGTVTRTGAVDIATISIVEENYQPVPAVDRQYARLTLFRDIDSGTTEWFQGVIGTVVLTRDGVAQLRDRLDRVVDYLDSLT